MLQTLQIEGLAIVDSLTIDFGDGFNVLTGETGAGKSILIKALSLLFGSKASSEVIRNGYSHATICGQFFVEANHPALLILQELEIEPEVGDKEFSIVIRRSISAKGRSQAFINDVHVSLSSLKHLGSALIDIYAQNESGRLLDTSSHLEYLDKFLPSDNELVRVKKLYSQNMELVSHLQSLIAEFKEKSREQDYLEFRLKELNEMSPSQEDYESAVSKYEESKDLEKDLRLIKDINNITETETSLGSMNNLLWKLAKLSEGLSLKEANRIKKLSSEIAYNFDEYTFAISQLSESFLLAHTEVESVEEKIAKYRGLFRKFGVSNVDELVQQKDEMESILDFINSAERLVHDLMDKLTIYIQQLVLSAESLRKKRNTAVEKIKSRLEKEFKELAMPGAAFAVEFKPIQKQPAQIDLTCIDAKLQELWNELANAFATTSENGSEKVQFLLRSNPGEPFLPLQKIASGGEMSRIMLAIKKALSIGASSCILVFDEIDTGISGRVASIVGSKLKELSKNFQVICISHLPQVAVYGEKHFYVSKINEKGRTHTNIRELDPKTREKEIARLLSGSDLTKPSLQNARDLLKASSI